MGHLAASCPNKGLCRRCKEPGHTELQCKKAWNNAQVSVPAVAGPSSSGVSPAAPASRPQRGAVGEWAPQASVPDPFEETKMLLAEAMDTESVASDVDDQDSEVDEVDEAVSDGSNGISDYDTSEEDHLLEDVDLSLEKTRSASKRAKCDSGVQSRNALFLLLRPLRLLCLLCLLRLLHLRFRAVPHSVRLGRLRERSLTLVL